jgi:glycosyltransferase involved in cell wall biosynthesis
MQTSPVFKHSKRKTTRNKILTIGWVGDSGNGDNLSHPFSHKTSLFKLLFTALSKIDRPFKLILIGIKHPEDIEEIELFFKSHKNIQLEIPINLDWKHDSWVYSEIMKFDIGVSPMIDHPFNEAKSAFKAKQYLSCGVPVIASNVGENSRFVNDNLNGIICHSEEDFKNAINRFYVMTDSEYFKFSTNCLKEIDDYSIDTYCERLIEIISLNRD